MKGKAEDNIAFVDIKELPEYSLCFVKREEVYIANVVKCRPPSNRNPQNDCLSDIFLFAHSLFRLYHMKRLFQQVQAP